MAILYALPTRIKTLLSICQRAYRLNLLATTYTNVVRYNVQLLGIVATFAWSLRFIIEHYMSDNWKPLNRVTTITLCRATWMLFLLFDVAKVWTISETTKYFSNFFWENTKIIFNCLIIKTLQKAILENLCKRLSIKYLGIILLILLHIKGYFVQ